MRRRALDLRINPDSPQANGLLGVWSFRLSPGLGIVPELTAGLDATLNAALSDSFASGIGHGLAFTNSSSQYLTLPGVASIKGLSQASYSAWYYPYSNPSDHVRVLYESTGTTTYTRFGILHFSDGTIRGYLRDSETSSSFSAASSAITLNALYKIDLTFNADSDALKLYLNGIQVASNTSSKGAFTGTTPVDGVKVNFPTGLPSYLNGGLYEIRIRNIEMSPELVWHEFDPATRFDLYRPTKRYWCMDVLGEQTALEDASLDLSAYYQSFENVATYLRAHDGSELEDLLTHLAAYFQSLEDAGSEFSAYFQSLEDALVSLDTCKYSLEDLSAPLQAAALVFENLKTYLTTLAEAREDLPALLDAAGYARHDLSTYLTAVIPLVLSDLGVSFETTDGTAFSSVRTYFSAVKRAPSFRSVMAQRVSSVVQEI